MLMLMVLSLTLKTVGGYGISAIRLSGGTASEGRLEVLHDGKWGAVCEIGFTYNDALVACRELGYTCGKPEKAGTYPGSSNRVWLRNAACDGNENTFDYCLMSFRTWDNVVCSTSQGTGLKCSDSSFTNNECLSRHVDNGAIVYEGRMCGDKASYTCDPGYRKYGSYLEAYCMGNDKWSTWTLHCKDCGIPGHNSKSTVDYSGTTLGHTANYTCDPGYAKVSGNSTRVCGTSAYWNGSAITCKANCSIEDIPNAVRSPEATYVLEPEIVSFTCQPGSILVHISATVNHVCSDIGDSGVLIGDEVICLALCDKNMTDMTFIPPISLETSMIDICTAQKPSAVVPTWKCSSNIISKGFTPECRGKMSLDGSVLQDIDKDCPRMCFSLECTKGGCFNTHKCFIAKFPRNTDDSPTLNMCCLYNYLANMICPYNANCEVFFVTF